MEQPKPPRRQRTLFERAEITTKDVVSFILFYGVFILSGTLYLWWERWGRNGDDPEYWSLRLMVLGWLFAFGVFAHGAIQSRLKKIATRDGAAPQSPHAQVDSSIQASPRKDARSVPVAGDVVRRVRPSTQTSRERFKMAAAIVILTAPGTYGIWWLKYGRDGEVTSEDISSLKFAFVMWFLLCLMPIAIAISEARRLRRQLDEELRIRQQRKKKKRKRLETPAGEQGGER